jgi:predicted enzyme related to lactoylglutathione lyase
MEMDPVIPAETPSYWTVYFAADDIDATFRTALDAGGREMVPPSPFPGGRFAIVADPHGAVFGLFAVDDR